MSEQEVWKWLALSGSWILWFIGVKAVIFGQYWPWQRCPKCRRKLNRHYCSAGGECGGGR